MICLLELRYIVLYVVSLPFEDVAAEDLEEHREPKEMQGAHRTQEYCRESQERIKMLRTLRVLCLGKDKPNHLWQAVDPRDKPGDHAADEGNGT